MPHEVVIHGGELNGITTAGPKPTPAHLKAVLLSRHNKQAKLCEDKSIVDNEIYSINGTALQAAIDLEPDSVSNPNTDGNISGNRIYNCGLGMSLFSVNINITITGNQFKASEVALNIVGYPINVNVTANQIQGGGDNTSVTVYLIPVVLQISQVLKCLIILYVDMEARV